MTNISHIPFAIEPERAGQTLSKLDWPGGVTTAADFLPLKRGWLPFNRKTGTNMLDRTKHPKLSRAVIPAKLISTGSPSAGPPVGKYLRPGSSHGAALFVPCYLFQEPANRHSWAVIEGISGTAVGGRLTADRRAAATRLCCLVLLALFTFFLATAYAHILLSNVFVLAGPCLMLLLGVIQGAIQGAIPGVVWLCVGALLLALLWMLVRWMMKRRDNLLSRLREPIHRFETGIVHLPLDRSWLPLVGAAGKVALILVPLTIVSLLLPLVLSQVAVGPELNAPSTLLWIVHLATVLAFGVAAARLSREGRLPSPSPADNTDASVRPAGTAADMVKVLLDVALLAMFGLIVGHVLDLSGMGDVFRRRLQMDPGLLSGIGVRVGAVVGVIASGVSWRDRTALVAGLSTELICDVVLGPWAGIPALLIVLIVVAAASRMSVESGTLDEYWPTPVWDALSTAWLFLLAATIGGIAGSVIGLVFLGPAGMVVGKMLGNSVIATTALLIWRPLLDLLKGEGLLN
jgi:hypothetical protein